MATDIPGYQRDSAAKQPGRKSKVISLSEAGKKIAKYNTIALLDGASPPMALIREAVRAGAKDLTLVPSMVVAHACDLLIAAGCVKSLYVCAAPMQFSPAFNMAAKAKTIDYIEADEPFMLLGARAAAYNLPYLPIMRDVWDAGVLPQQNSMIRRVKDPYTGEEVLTIPPLKAQVCLLHVPEADEYGNVQMEVGGGGLHEPDKVKSATEMVIISAEEIVPNERIRENPGKTIIPGHLVDAVVYAPFGAHPLGVPRRYRPDVDNLTLYRELVQSGREKEFLSRFLLEPKDHYDYLARIGIERLFGLRYLISE